VDDIAVLEDDIWTARIRLEGKGVFHPVFVVTLRK
jgi:hypothetical protein